MHGYLCQSSRRSSRAVEKLTRPPDGRTLAVPRGVRGSAPDQSCGLPPVETRRGCPCLDDFARRGSARRRAQRSPQCRFAEEDQLREALIFHRRHPAPRVRIQVRAARRQPTCGHPGRATTDVGSPDRGRGSGSRGSRSPLTSLPSTSAGARAGSIGFAARPPAVARYR